MQKEIDLCSNPMFPYRVIDSHKDVELSIGIKDSCLYIGFLGSVSAKDWLHNFMFWKKPYKQMKSVFFVHTGFLKIYKICRDEIHSFIESHKSEFTSVHISGHSLGAAIATLCYEDISYLKETGLISTPITGLITGSPRVFGIFGSKIIKRRCAGLIRLVNKNDIVPRIPSLYMAYTHVVPPLKKGKPSIFLTPSSVYNHDIEAYKYFLDDSRIETEQNNSLYPVAISIFKYIYLFIAITFSLIATAFIVL